VPTIKLRKDDRVQVMAGKDAGKEGRIVKVFIDKGKVMVEGVNRVKRHEKVRQSRAGAMQGGIVEKEAPVDISNVQLICGACSKPTRIGYRFDDANKIRICRKCGADL